MVFLTISHLASEYTYHAVPIIVMPMPTQPAFKQEKIPVTTKTINIHIINTKLNLDFSIKRDKMNLTDRQNDLP